MTNEKKTTVSKSFLMYQDMESVFERLSGEESRALLLGMFRYHRGEEPQFGDRMLEILFEPLRLQMDRDREKYRRTIQARAEAGRKGGKARKKNSGDQRIMDHFKTNF